MKFDPTGLVPLNFADCWLICYFALAASTPPRPPAHPVERAAHESRGPGGEEAVPAAIVQVTPAGLSVNGRPSKSDGLAAALKRVKTKGPLLTVEVKVADGVPYRDVDAVLAAARNVPGVKLRLRRLQ